MKRASISEAKNKLSALIDQVKSGETVVITNRGRPVARLEPIIDTESDEERLTRLERAGLVRRGKRTGAWRKVLKHPPIPVKKGYSVVQMLLDEREEGR